jgi:hypothetical protein
MKNQFNSEDVNMKGLFCKMILGSIAIASLVSCNKKEATDYTKYENYARLFQASSTTSGNCAVIRKTIEADGNAVYSATASAVASGRCRESSFFTFVTTADEAKIKADAYYNGMTLTFDKYPDCSELIKTGVASRELVSPASLSSAASASANGCITVVPKVFYCKDNASLTAFRNTFRYQTITNAKADMRTSYDSIVSANALANKVLDLKYEEAVIGNLRIANTSEITLFDGAESNAVVSSFAQDSTCFKKLILGNTNLKSAYSKIPTLQEFFKEEINVSDRKAVTETITPNLYCRYGTNATALPASGVKPAVGICPSSYPVF